MKNAKQYFDNHDEAQKLYFTSDNLAFFDEHNATSHARKLKDKTVTALSRSEVEKETYNLTDNWEQEMNDLLDEMEGD